MGSVALGHSDTLVLPAWTTRRSPPVEPPAGSRATTLGLVGASPVMQALFVSLERFAPHARATLITGETGTGKAALARVLHRLGPLGDSPFVTVPCAPLAGRAVDLRGGLAAAWTDLADHGPALEPGEPITLFFDEIADLSIALQAALVHTLEALDPATPGAGSGDGVHVIAATSHDLRAEMAAGRFRADLYYRLAVFELHVPPLRERLEDVPDLAEAFLAQIGARMGRPGAGLTGGAKRLLQSLAWAGNLRELRNVLERARLVADGGLVGEAAIRAALVSAGTPPPSGAPLAVPEPSTRLDDAQRAHVRAVLESTHGNKSVAATRLGISRRALYRLIDKLDA